MPLFRTLAKNMAPMTNADESPTNRLTLFPIYLSLFIVSTLWLKHFDFSERLLVVETKPIKKLPLSISDVHVCHRGIAGVKIYHYPAPPWHIPDTRYLQVCFVQVYNCPMVGKESVTLTNVALWSKPVKDNCS